MKKFLQLLEEKKKTLAVLFGRMNPPTKGHEETIDGLKKIAKEHRADHLVIASHSHDTKRNPLDNDNKSKHLKRAFPDTNITFSSKEKPTIIHHATDAYNNGYNHFIVTGGGDRVKELHDLVKKYNGVTGRHGYYKFDNIASKSTGDRKSNISGTELRKHVKNRDMESFKSLIPSHIVKNNKHTKEFFDDVGKGLGINEDTLYGILKAVFIVGGPGSGKDIIIREGISINNAVELNFSQVKKYLGDKNKLHESIRQRLPLIINGNADNYDDVVYIKEELEELGYSTMMIFVDTTNDVSKQRNQNLNRVVTESVRADKWEKSQSNKLKYHNIFNDINIFENNNDVNSIEEFMSDVSIHTKEFSESRAFNSFGAEWLLNNYHSKLDINEQVNLLVMKENYDVDIHKNENEKFNESNTRCNHKFNRFIKENNCPTCQLTRKLGKRDDVRDGDVAPNSGYSGLAAKTYESKSIDANQAPQEFESQRDKPTLKITPEVKTPNFEKDKEIAKSKKSRSAVNGPGKIQNTGMGPDYDSRGVGGASSLGNVTYRESVDDKYLHVAAEATSPKSFSNFRIPKVSEAIDDPGANDMGMAGVMGSTNKEPLQTPGDKVNSNSSGISIRKRTKKVSGD